jgi:hypothetical protein
MHLEAEIVKLRDAHAGHVRMSLKMQLEAEMDLEAVIERVW